MKFQIMDKMQDVVNIFVSPLPCLHFCAFLFCVSSLISGSPGENSTARYALAILFIETSVVCLFGAYNGSKLKKAKTSKGEKEGAKEEPSTPVSPTTPARSIIVTSKGILKKQQTRAGSKMEKKVKFKLSHDQIYAEMAKAKTDVATNAIPRQLSLDELCEVTGLLTAKPMAVASESIMSKPASSESVLRMSAARKSSPGALISRASTSTVSKYRALSSRVSSRRSAILAHEKMMKEEKIDCIDWAERPANSTLENTLEKEQIVA
ncbi:hypothetical protein E2P81_ATG08118 [Venturia nashicola]|uniref:Uncharacterized protein n=1 Tax=Venturia nashicola TaxID=86259 RepID=A0A4Z1P0M8_9PEZI|nr:hypothetical protein E6O75_ATG08291 [Venturia nashicola]TLD26306.1 hypothetical protein E2P81_ATG08118 [Venturia nashicola]